ncbi:DUF3563 domain-containing protein [Oryzibacter oryziterrae]|uniref:DUF3563 domain-containing protein n=1 Tax=Oryzibacter oryziterrae TaxID=2766474 RepID=UPI001F15CF41|nr:DUF3563 domain-containing protein [Oryzibacter oryziterrae]
MFATLKRTAKMFHIPTAAEREQAYVNGATDRFDLEAREREVGQGRFQRRGFAL